MKKWIAGFAVALGLLAGATAYAEEVAPDVQVRTVTNDVVSIVKQDKDIQSGNTRKVLELVDQKVLPHFNFGRMTALAVGRDWRSATPEQQKQLTAEFRTLLVKTYSNALTEYRDQKIEVKPLKLGPTDTDVTVRTQVSQPGRQPVALDYSLQKTDAGWKVYDVAVAGVSLVTNYRESFAAEVRSGGIDGLIKSLQAKNRG